MKEVKTYMCDYNCTPTNEEIESAFELAKQNNCIIKIQWTLEYSGEYMTYVTPDSNVEDVIKSIRNTVYPI